MEGTTLKSKVVNIVLGVVLVISVVGNIYMVKLSSEAKEDVAAIRNQLAAADNQIVDLEGQLTSFAQVQGHVADLQGQLTDFEKVQTEVFNLQKQLTESKDLIESLESTITEQNITVAGLEEQRANQEQLLLAAQANANKQYKQAQQPVAQPVGNDPVYGQTGLPPTDSREEPGGISLPDPDKPIAGWDPDSKPFPGAY